MITEKDIEPVLALVSEIEQTRIGAGWRADENGEPIKHEPTANELLAALYQLHQAGRRIYDELAAKVDGARSYDDIMDPPRQVQGDPDDPDVPF